jgi:hypothetical protein
MTTATLTRSYYGPHIFADGTRINPIIKFIESINENNSLPLPCYHYPSRNILSVPSILIKKLEGSLYEVTVIVTFEEGDSDHQIDIKFDIPAIKNKSPILDWDGVSLPPPTRLLRDYKHGPTNFDFTIVTSKNTESFQFVVDCEELDNPELISWERGNIVITFILES